MQEVKKTLKQDKFNDIILPFFILTGKPVEAAALIKSICFDKSDGICRTDT